MIYLTFAVMNDPLEHATGIEKRELLAKAAGNENPFDMRVFKRGAGTKDQPNLIPSAFDARLVGCICEEDQTFVQWMWVYQVRKKDSLSFRENFKRSGGFFFAGGTKAL